MNRTECQFYLLEDGHLKPIEVSVIRQMKVGELCKGAYVIRTFSSEGWIDFVGDGAYWEIPRGGTTVERMEELFERWGGAFVEGNGPKDIIRDDRDLMNLLFIWMNFKRPQVEMPEAK